MSPKRMPLCHSHQSRDARSPTAFCLWRSPEPCPPACWHKAIPALIAILATAIVLPPLEAAEGTAYDVGIASRDVTPEEPIWLGGYASREHPSVDVDQPLKTQALALRDREGDRFVLVAVDNCEISESFRDSVWKVIGGADFIERSRLMLVASHTHSAPVLADSNLLGMYPLSDEDYRRLQAYTDRLRQAIAMTVKEALTDLKPATLHYANGKATFAVNRRAYTPDGMAFGENLDGPTLWDVPVLKIARPDGEMVGVLFGYSCHATTISGDDFYTVSSDFVGYAREHIERLFPDATAIFASGMGADSNPMPRGSLRNAKKHGLQLAGTVVGILNRPMRRLQGGIELAYREVDLPLTSPPDRKQLEADAQSENRHVRHRAKSYLSRLEETGTLPESVPTPVAAIRLGGDVTWLAIAGEVVVDYGRRFKRLFKETEVWPIGYAYQVPCYIPSIRVLLEGGYEADHSMLYYGYYGRFKREVEPTLVNSVKAVMEQSAGRE